MATFDELKTKAQEIKNEILPEANTATRVGEWMEEMTDQTAQLERDIVGDIFILNGSILRDTANINPNTTYKCTPFLTLTDRTLIVKNLWSNDLISAIVYYNDNFQKVGADSQTIGLVSKKITPDAFPPTSKYIRCTIVSGQIDAYVVGIDISYGNEVYNNIIQMMLALDYTIYGALTYENDCVKACAVMWSDGSVGRLTFSNYNDSEACYTAFEVTNPVVGLKVVQAPATFNSEGQITNYPVLTINSL